jgi:peptidoglycan/LPS O-acetylase OafA/YrhL
MASADTTSMAPARPSPRTTAAGPPSPARLGALDGLRGLAALGVLVLHVWMFHHGDSGRPPKHLLDYVIGELRLGVQLFFVLSGFLLYRPFVGAVLDGAPRPSLRRYGLRRAARILPAYAATVLGAFLLLRHLDHPMQVGAGQLPIFLLFAQNQFDATIKHLDPPMWTLAVEVSFYAALPLAALLAPRLGASRARQLGLPLAVAAAGAACTAAAARYRWPVTLSTSLLLHLVEFGAGMAVATLLHRRRVSRPVAAALVLAGATLVLASSWWHALAIGPQQTRDMVGDAPGILGLALVVAAIAGASWRAAALSRGPVRWLGTVSYGVYLAHFPVIVAVRRTGHWPAGLTSELLLVSAVTLALATASWLVLERPAIRWARRVTRPRSAGLPAPSPAPAPAVTHRPRHRAAGELRVLRPQPGER